MFEFQKSNQVVSWLAWLEKLPIVIKFSPPAATNEPVTFCQLTLSLNIFPVGFTICGVNVKWLKLLGFGVTELVLIYAAISLTATSKIVSPDPVSTSSAKLTQKLKQ